MGVAALVPRLRVLAPWLARTLLLPRLRVIQVLHVLVVDLVWERVVWVVLVLVLVLMCGLVAVQGLGLEPSLSKGSLAEQAEQDSVGNGAQVFPASHVCSLHISNCP